jgi:peroxiredoxin
LSFGSTVFAEELPFRGGQLESTEVVVVMQLQEQLDEITANTRSLVQPERLAISDRSIEELLFSGAESHVLRVGDAAPAFELLDFTGKMVRSADLLALGPLILSFFRGRWCPYCATELEAWRDLESPVRERGALLVAISPQTQRHNDFTADRHSLSFPVLSDPGCAVAERFGLVYSLPDSMQKYYRSILVNIPFVNGDPSWRLPLPGTFVIARDGTIVFAEAHADFRVRPEPRAALEALNSAI